MSHSKKQDRRNRNKTEHTPACSKEENKPGCPAKTNHPLPKTRPGCSC